VGSVLPLVAALASLGLMYAVGARIFGGAGWGIVTGALFASTPLIWRQFQIAPSSLYPLPFVIGWLVAVAQFQATRAPRWLAVAGALLGAGVYTSHPAAVMMPLYLLLTIAVFAYSPNASVGRLAVFVGAFAAAAGPFVLSLVLDPARFRNIVNASRLYDANRFNVLQGMREMASWVGLTARSEVYYDYFNPAFLFITGGVLLWPLVVLIPAGLYHIAISETTPLTWLSLGGFFVAPFAAALTAAAPMPGRIMFITPFAAIVSVYGVQRLLLWATASVTRMREVPHKSRAG
jgi:hypothetical protein